MHLIHPQDHSRRAFLRRSAQLAFTGAALPTALNLAAMGEAAAFNATDYKALVCVFMYGGNDYANTVVNYDDASYNEYNRIRGGVTATQGAGGIALAKSALLPLGGTLLNASRQYGFHPKMTGLKTLYDSGQAAVQLNVGPLVVPMNRDQYFATNRNTYPLPPKLFSHNDQQSLWQSSSPEGSTVGWGGNIGDLALSGNSGSSALFTCISVTGNAVFLAGDSALSYQVSTGGAVKIKSASDQYTYGSKFIKDAMLNVAQQARGHVLENEYNIVTKRAIGAEVAITAGLSAGDAADPKDSAGKPTNPKFVEFTQTMLDKNPLASQLKMVARLIAARNSLGPKRQVFFVSMGGFDNHDGLLVEHDKNLARVSEAMSAFYATTKALGIDASVTSFTASDFGRTFSSNGDGSDHGWGSHHMIVGGAVKGGKIYGYAPPVGVGNTTNPEDAWHVGQGRLLPTTSVDQYAATLAQWFGVQDDELNGILPNLRNFTGQTTPSGIVYPRNVGFV
jgi:uncharacterized protein (DUF1501 family)